MNELDERAQGWLEAARSGHDPSSTDAARVQAALKARLLADPELLEPKPISRLVPRGLRKLLGVFGAGGVLGFSAGIYVARAFLPVHSLEAPPTAPRSLATVAANAHGSVTASAAAAAGIGAAAASATGAVTSGGAGTGSADQDAETRGAPRESGSPLRDSPNAHRETLEAGRRGTRTHPAHESASDGNRPSPLKAELDGLRRAQELVHQNEPAWALARLEELDRAQVGSVLLEERAATRAIAECMLGRTGAEREFSQRFPGSPHTEQVRASCEKALSNAAKPTQHAPRQTESPSSRHE